MSNSTVKNIHFLTPAEINEILSKKPDLVYSYGEHEKQILELRLPSRKESPVPVVVLIHGGCWRETFASLKNTAALADALRDKGLAIVNVEYRCIDSQGGGWPGTFLDIAHAIDSLKVLSKKFPIDLNKTVSLGHSSGGTLALWAAARPKIPTTSELFTSDPMKIRGAISLGGLGDLRHGASHLDSICGTKTVTSLLGDQIEGSKDHYKVSSPVELLPLGIPQIFITGEDDKAAPLKFGKDYIQKAVAVGDGRFVSQIEVKNCGHHEYIHPKKDTFSIILNQINQILEKYDSGN